MAERGKAEETERTEAGRRTPSPAEWEDFVRETAEHMHALFGDSAEVDVRLHTAGEDPSDVDVVVEAKLASIPVTVVPDEHFIQRASRVSRPGTGLLPELDEPVERDDAYYDEVRQAVGRGAPSVLLGTSTKSLDRSLEKLRTVHGASGASQTMRPSPRDRRPPFIEDEPAERMVGWRLLQAFALSAVVILIIGVVWVKDTDWFKALCIAGIVVYSLVFFSLFSSRFREWLKTTARKNPLRQLFSRLFVRNIDLRERGLSEGTKLPPQHEGPPHSERPSRKKR